MNLRALPSVDRLLQSGDGRELIQAYGRPLTTEAIRIALDQARSTVLGGGSAPKEEALLQTAQQSLLGWLKPTLQPVVNASGVVIHTNLGRAPLSNAAQQAMLDVAQNYSTLEYDPILGRRGKREVHAESLLRRITNAEAALVVNNNAAAVLLALTGLAKEHEVIIARSQLIEIGGGFRIPDVLHQSGASLVEVGTTNRTHLHDFENAITENTRLILRAHHSNFKIIGFTTEPSLEELVALGQRHSIPVVDDLGSGTLLDTGQFGLGHEPTIQESLRAGAGVVTFSGDKLLGGPQAGLLIGQKTLIDQLRRHPLARAVRPDKLCLAALNATLQHYLRDEALEHIPIWRMIATPAEEIQARAANWQKAIGTGEVIAGKSTIGGGSLPEETLPTWLLALRVNSPTRLAQRLRECQPAIIARIENDQVLLDPRTVLLSQESHLQDSLRELLAA